jgi:hypothetical protein
MRHCVSFELRIAFLNIIYMTLSRTLTHNRNHGNVLHFEERINFVTGSVIKMNID